MHKIELTSGQLEYLQELVMFGYEMEVPEQKGWDVQTYDNLVDAVMQQCQFTKWHIVPPLYSKVGYIKYIPNKGAKMQLTPIASNMTEVETSEARILFSYRTPVAAYVYGTGYVRTEKYWSVTTSRHINKWIGGKDVPAKEVAQTYLDNLVQGVIMSITNAIFLFILIVIFL